jgi:hypothetical protein
MFRSGNAVGPEGGKALAVPLEQLTALQQLDLRYSKGGENTGVTERDSEDRREEETHT